MLGLWGAAGFDPTLCADDQPKAASRAIELTFLAGLPLLSALNAILLLYYPIQGERLLRLQQAKEEEAGTLTPIARHMPTGMATAAEVTPLSIRDEGEEGSGHEEHA